MTTARERGSMSSLNFEAAGLLLTVGAGGIIVEMKSSLASVAMEIDS